MRGQPVQVRHASSVPDCLESVRGRRGTLLLVELGPQPVGVLELLDRVRGLDPDVMVLVVGRQVPLPVELLARELGAVGFIREPIAPREVADVVERFFRSRQTNNAEESSRWKSPNQVRLLRPV